MNFSFAEALSGLGPNVGARIANAARPTANYLFSTFLPERRLPSYTVDAANMIVRTTMAGLVGMDSPYPPGGQITVEKFLENTAKIAIHVPLAEQALRQVQTLAIELQANGQNTNEFLQREILNFLDKVIIQSLLDTGEWLRGQALTSGAIAWDFGGKTLSVDYGIPTANKLTVRTNSNNDAYADTSSAFWTDVAEARRLLRYNVRAAIMNSVTADQILRNTVNAVGVLAQDNTRLSIRRYITIGGNTVPDSDSRYAMEFIIYDEEAEVWDTANPGRTKIVKFMPDGKIIFVGQNTDSGYRVGQGSTDNPKTGMELGYFHLAPTTESGGVAGRWAQVYTPEALPMQLHGRAAENSLPVLTAPSKIVIAQTELL